MNIGYLGAGAWGFCLANLLAGNGHKVTLWTIEPKLADALAKGESHPVFRDYRAAKHIRVTTSLEETLEESDLVIESVTSGGVRPVLKKVLATKKMKAPLVITSKGIEQGTHLLLSEIALEVLGEGYRDKIGCLSGPSLASEVMRKLPASVVCAAYNYDLMMEIKEVFATPFFRVYPNTDVAGISFGGAMKNIIAIACAISDGLGYGDNAKAALMTRGLHEIRKLSAVKGCRPETINGLAGLGDLCTTCLSPSSRNNRFGKLLAEGFTPEEAKEKIGMVVEGAYTCVSALELSKEANIPVPITEVVYQIIYEGLDPSKAVYALLSREVKEEHL
jgi:glycerol-3-phosphate dehydrogenase (NAD(P)+)